MEQSRESRKNPHMYGQLTLDKGAKNIPWEKDSLFNRRRWENQTAHAERAGGPPFYTTHGSSQVNSKRMTDLNVRTETVKREDTGKAS